MDCAGVEHQDNNAMKRQSIEVGSTVRLTANVGGITVSRRSLVATPPDENGCVSLEQDDLAPEPLKRRKFLIAPLFNIVGAVVKGEPFFCKYSYFSGLTLNNVNREYVASAIE